MDGSQRISNVSQQSGDFAIKDNAPLTDATAELSQENIDVSELEQKFTQARSAMLALQNLDGHWCFPLEADCTIPAEYILMMHFMDEVDVAA